MAATTITAQEYIVQLLLRFSLVLIHQHVSSSRIVVTCWAETSKSKLLVPFVNHWRAIFNAVQDSYMLVWVGNGYLGAIVQNSGEVLIDTLSSQSVVFAQQLLVFTLKLEELVKNFSMLIAENSHISVYLYVLSRQAVNHAHKRLNLLILLLLYGNEGIHFHLHTIKVAHEFAHGLG